MFAVPLAPRQPDGLLRAVVYVRDSTDTADLEARCDELADRIRAVYDWPLEFYFFGQQRDGLTPTEEIVWLLGAGDWEVLVVEELTRLCRDWHEFTSSLSDVSTLADE